MDILLQNILKAKDFKGITDRRFVIDLEIPSSSVSEWKSGKSKSYTRYLPKIADYLEVSVDTLLGNEKSSSSEDDELASYLKNPHNREFMELFDELSKSQKDKVLSDIRWLLSQK